jgi:adenylyltransferase/sulfurtransferase
MKIAGFFANTCLSHLNDNNMEAATQSAHSLKRQILEAEEQLANLREQLQKVELTITLKKPPFEGHSESSTHGNYEKDGKTYHGSETKWPLSSEEYKRYGRQMIVPSIGIQGIYQHPFLHQLAA